MTILVLDLDGVVILGHPDGGRWDKNIERDLQIAPARLGHLLGLIVRPNKTQISRQVYEAKIGRWSTLWPGFHVVPWDQVPAPHGVADLR